MYLTPVTCADARNEMAQSLSRLEDDAKICVVKTSGPSKLQMPFKNADIYSNVGNVHKDAFQFLAQGGELRLTTKGKDYQLSQGGYVVINQETGESYSWSSSSGTTNSDILLFERKKKSIRFGLIAQNGVELTWEDPIAFMFLGLVTNDAANPYVVFSSGVGGPNGFGGLMMGSDPHIVGAAFGAYCALDAIMQGPRSPKNEEKERLGDYNGQIF